MRLLNYWVWIDTPHNTTGPILIPLAKLPEWEKLGWQETENVAHPSPAWHFYTSGDYPFTRPPNSPQLAQN